MIINRAILKVKGSEYDILRFNYKFQRDVDTKGRPCSVYYGGEMFVQLESTDDMRLFQQMIDKDMPTVDGSIEVLSGDGEICVRRIEFKESYIYSHGEQIQCTSSLPMITTVSISPMRLDFNNDTLRLDRKWPRANGWQKYVKEKIKVAQKPAEQETEVATIEIITPLTKLGGKEGIEFNKTYTLRVTQYTNGAPKDTNMIRWQYSYTADDGSITVVGLPNSKGDEVKIKLNNANILSQYITFKAYINDGGSSCNAIIIPAVPNGVFLWIETKGTGHVFVSVQYNDMVYIYTYGRYDDGKGPYGEGVLIKYTNTEAQEYIKTELHRLNASVFEIKDIHPIIVIGVFNAIWSRSTEIPNSQETSDKIKTHGRVVDNYNLLSNNCTTVSCKALKKSGTKIFNRKGIAGIEYTEDFTIPNSLDRYLKEIDSDNPHVEDVRSLMMAIYPKDSQIPMKGSGGSIGSASGVSGQSSGSSANSSSMEEISSGSDLGSSKK